MSAQAVTVDAWGVRVPARITEACDVHFDGRHVWSFSPTDSKPDASGVRSTPWPHAMQARLDGVAHVTVSSGGREIFDADLRFGAGLERVSFVDKRGLPIMIDKWGLVQRPFSGRGGGAVEHMVEATERIFEILERDCGVKAWIAFGTLLGAVRSGKVIGHDSDIDLAYLSDESTPAAMAREMFSISRALRRAGLRVMNKSGSFITVLLKAPDGGQSSIDIYTCFYVADLLYETATVRARVPRSAIEPLTRIEFEGRMLPAPADPDAILTASYGPNWRVPDPSFAHRPGPEIKQRFDPWFGSLMRHRRNWERSWRGAGRTEPSEFARWVGERLEPGRPVVDLGTGAGGDALALARAGHQVLALDYSRGSYASAARRARRRGLPASFDQLNLYDFRDVATRAALVSRTLPGPRSVFARGLVEALEPDGVENFWRFADLVLRGHGTAYLEFGGPLPPAGPMADEQRFRLTPQIVESQVTAAGGQVLELEAAARPKGPHTWRMSIEWKR